MRPHLDDLTHEALTDFIRTKVLEGGSNGVVVGLSGGIDSAVVTKLCIDAIGPRKVLNLFLPSSSTPSTDRDDVHQMCEAWGTELKEMDISSMVEDICAALPSPERKELRGNIMARVRMMIIYHHANLLGRLVMGTGNKSELLVGYFTKWGDGGADYLPLGDLYKTQVRELAEEIGVPERIIVKEPSAGLWKGQTDEGEMGITYDELDQILMGLERSMSDEEMALSTNIDPATIAMVRGRHLASVHKRKMPLIPKLSPRTIGSDWRE